MITRPDAEIITLNDQQKRIVHSDNHEIVVSCPGSGKTRLLIAKVLYLLQSGVKRIHIITFTREAAKE
jgi:superfamily I DNA/RNA helicase